MNAKSHPAYAPSKRHEQLAIDVREAHRQYQRAILELESAEREFENLKTEIPRLKALVEKLRQHRNLVDQKFENEVAKPEQISKEQQIENLKRQIAQLQAQLED